MSKIFISYRRDDSAGHALNLHERLAGHFGAQHIFMDIDNIEPGEDFVAVIEEKVGACDVLLALIGKTWLAAVDETGRRRLENPEDFVRLEIATALQRKIRVIPVLVDGAKPPKPGELPEALAPLSRRNAVELSHTRFGYDVGRLLASLDQVLAAGRRDDGVERPADNPASSPKRSNPSPPSSRRPRGPQAPRPKPPSDFEVFRDRLRDGGEGPEMIRISSGRFRMGDLSGKGFAVERPVRWVSIANSFALGRYPVTFEEYEAYARSARYPIPDDRGWGRGRRPVINVSWDDALAYTRWISEQTGKPYRLPYEAEWEYAARAGTETEYWWGNEIGSKQANGEGSGSDWSAKQTSPVGSFDPNPWGLYDTAGNVWEWVQDGWHNDYRGAPDDGSVWEFVPRGFSLFGFFGAKGTASGDRRVIRGGSWRNEPEFLRSGGRFWSFTDGRNFNLGFRLARDLP